MTEIKSIARARFKAVTVLFLAAGCAASQTRVDLRTQGKDVDFGDAVSTRPVQTGNALPSTCGVGALYFLTAAPAGANLYACVAADTWKLEDGAAQTSGSGAPSGACLARAVYNDTLDGNTWLCESATWQKVLTTADTGPFVLTGQNGSTPAPPAAGNTALFFNSTARIAQSLDDTGAPATMVRPTDCGAGVLQTINADGTASCRSTISTVHAVGYTFDGSGSALTSGLTRYLTVPFACTISGWNITVDTGTATLKVWKVAAGSEIPTVSDSISVSGVSIASGTAIHSSNVSDFSTTAIGANDILGFNLFAVSSATYVNFILECR